MQLMTAKRLRVVQEIQNYRITELAGEEMLQEERGEDAGRAGRAVRTIATTVKDVRLEAAASSSSCLRPNGDEACMRHFHSTNHAAVLTC